MKIAIYGDSFGNHCLENFPGDSRYRGLGWPEILNNQKDYEVTNFSCSGSSLFYSYKLFLENNKNFDYNIFLVTEPNRITLPEESIIPGTSMTPHINLSLVDSLSRFEYNQTLVSAITLYYGLIHNFEAIELFHKLMVENITQVNQNTLVIPCFHTSISYTPDNLMGISDMEMSEYEMWLTLKDNKYYPWTIIEDETGLWTFNDYRKCHLNEENNKILATMIYQAINNNQQTIDLSLSQFVKSKKDPEHYFFYVDLTTEFNEGPLNGRLHNLYIKLLIDRN